MSAFTFSAQSDIGRVRKNNEDYHLADEKLGLFIVCDGVGGHASGEVASKLAATTIQQVIAQESAKIQHYVAQPSPEKRAELAHLVERAVETANARVYEFGEANPEHHGMSTTAEVCLVVGSHIIIGHVGDSRTYLIRENKVHILTEDHKVSAEMKKSGQWSDADIKNSQYANVLTRALGTQEFVRPDLLKVETSPGDQIVLCSDGLHDYLAEAEELAEKTRGDISGAARTLVEFACARGGRDNVSVIAIQISGAPAQAQEEKTDTLDALKKSNILGKVPLFRYLSYAELLKVLSVMKVKEYEAGDVLIHENEPGDHMFVTVSGAIEVVKKGQIISRRGKGEFFGEMGLIDNAKRSASIRASESTTTLYVTRKDLLELFRKESQICVKFLWALNQELNQRLRVTTQELIEARAMPVDDTEIEVPFPKSM